MNPAQLGGAPAPDGLRLVAPEPANGPEKGSFHAQFDQLELDARALERRFGIHQPLPEPAPPAIEAPSVRVDAGAATRRDATGWNAPYERHANLFARLERVLGHASEQRVSFHERGLAPDHPEVVRFMQEHNTELLGLQLELGNAQFEMELVSKVIEHGTSGTRQILQTQA